MPNKLVTRRQILHEVSQTNVYRQSRMAFANGIRGRGKMEVVIQWI